MPFQKVSRVCSYNSHFLNEIQIRFLGGKLGKALAEEFDAATVNDLLCIDLGKFEIISTDSSVS